MRIFPLLTLGVAASLAHAQPNEAPQTMAAPPKERRVRPTEPGKQITEDLLAFAKVINGGNLFPEGQGWIYGARIGYFGANEWAKEINLQRQGITLVIENISVDKIEGEMASATVNYSFGVAKGDAARKEHFGRERTEVVPLHLSAQLAGRERFWQIVPPDAQPNQPGMAQLDGIWAFLTYHLAQKQPFDGAQGPAKRSMNQLKQLGLGAMQFLQDWDERYAFAPEYLQEALTPYLKNNELFYVPGSRETYSFNPNLSDKSLAQVNEAAQTVLFYEGKDEKPNFRYDGKAAICFADGHVALVSPDAAEKLIWKP